MLHTRKNYLSRKEIAWAVKDHECIVCGEGFGWVANSGFVAGKGYPLVMPSRNLVHSYCRDQYKGD